MFNLIGRLPYVDAIAPEEVVGQLTHGDALMRRRTKVLVLLLPRRLPSIRVATRRRVRRTAASYPCGRLYITETTSGGTRALQPQQLYETQQYATAVYRSELAARLQGMSYEIERGAHGHPETKADSRECMEASSPRQLIKDHLAEHGRTGPEDAEIAAHHIRSNLGGISTTPVDPTEVAQGADTPCACARCQQLPAALYMSRIDAAPISAVPLAHEGDEFGG